MKYKGRKKLSIKQKVLIAISSILCLVLIAGLCGYLYLNSMINKVNFQNLSSNNSAAPNKDTTDNFGNPLMADRDVLNVLLVGLDNREDTTEGGRSDSMIILSLNQKTKRIIMTSIMRDTYVPIAGHGSNRLNSAYSFGGMNLLISTIQKNFDIKINRYVTVDFAKFINIVDQLGGVEIEVSDKEVPVLNNYVAEINRIQKKPLKDGAISHGGKLLLNGKQALAYSRIRYVGNADFERTHRQRIVLNTIFNKLKQQNVLQLTFLLNTILPEITTDLTQDELRGLVLNSLTYKNYDIVQNRIPIDGSYTGKKINGMDVLVVDFDKNIESLKSVIFGTSLSPNKQSM
ncbi:hypothetical protein CCDG5_1835 [[Clostridium] cellulosi]|uniref:Cell envelope-related transcriptional attenuator domain-containing protein n=1 Tax=[Clostridium] cellulosi TaxID=29343 RepID=A0A078KRB1_9FIRM|nr:hypothetical protein CCDG5_1835 [[Clostridium] cellulosi]